MCIRLIGPDTPSAPPCAASADDTCGRTVACKMSAARRNRVLGWMEHDGAVACYQTAWQWACMSAAGGMTNINAHASVRAIRARDCCLLNAEHGGLASRRSSINAASGLWPFQSSAVSLPHNMWAFGRMAQLPLSIAVEGACGFICEGRYMTTCMAAAQPMQCCCRPACHAATQHAATRPHGSP